MDQTLYCSTKMCDWEALFPRKCQCLQEPRNLASYKANNIFLADINNDRDTKNPLYRENLVSLQKFVMFRFQHDTTVVPRDSAWFGWYNGSQLLTMNQTDLYKVRCMSSCLTVCKIRR